MMYVAVLNAVMNLMCRLVDEMLDAIWSDVVTLNSTTNVAAVFAVRLDRKKLFQSPA
jgi:hypothetical protein